jgi:hypothetical protein
MIGMSGLAFCKANFKLGPIPYSESSIRKIACKKKLDFRLIQYSKDSISLPQS